MHSQLLPHRTLGSGQYKFGGNYCADTEMIVPKNDLRSA